MKIRKQKDIKDCGIYVIQGLYNFFYKKWININQIKYLAEYEKDGISISSFSKVSQELRISIESYKTTWNDFLNFNFNFPIVTLIKIDDFLHYICIENIAKEYITINDSINGKRKIHLNSFKELFIGIVLLAKKDPAKHIDSCFFQKNKIIISAKSSLWILNVVLGCIMPIMGYYLSFINKSLFQYIELHIRGFSLQYLILFGWSSLVLNLLKFLNSFCIKKIKLKLAKYLKQMFINKLKNADQKQLDKINKNEILIRYHLIDFVSEFLANKFYLFSNLLVSFALSFSLFFFIKIKIILFLLALYIIKIILAIFIDTRIKNLNKTIIENNIKEINDISFISYYYDLYNSYIWNNVQKHNFNQHLSLSAFCENKLQNWINFKSLLNSILFLISQITIFFIFINSSPNHLSNLFFIISIQSLLNSPIMIIQNYLTNKSIFSIYLERILFILNIPQNFLKSLNYKIETIQNISVKNLSIKHGNKWVFNSLNLNIKHNTKILGNNGVGKSSLLKVFAGFFKDKKNCVFYNEINLKDIDSLWIENNVFYVDNNFNFPNIDLYTYLFVNINSKVVSEMLKNNIFLNLIKSLNLELCSNLKYNENKLSLGQKQIIKLLPLLIRKYKLVILDESFEYLSKKIFKKFKKIILNFQTKALVLETSHSNRFLYKNSDKFCIKNI
ncbi:ATP-binding cassette domain-containing protein [Metamycoplasma phocicerebrale]|uniref:ATP-binding cassette domain-containing protein n=1 Tax=Metamycoplasma phocicerebrale TaxID=142649 RepID=A0A3T0TUD5_9BACT|nr:cysteine peptidase family C39 domain-containing protein [Metamycoplasma phocicerebrale]AZZ65732.1 ATP-binding cassette domain-containing protein [Metamycoplasma phocicerebrale]